MGDTPQGEKMKIQDLIKKLVEIETEHGNVSVSIWEGLEIHQEQNVCDICFLSKDEFRSIEESHVLIIPGHD